MKSIPHSMLKIKKIYDIIIPAGKILQDIDKNHQFNDNLLENRTVKPQNKEVFAIIGILMWMFMIKYLLDFLGVFGEILFFLLIPLSALSHLVGEVDEFQKNSPAPEEKFPRARVIEIFLLQIIYIGFAFFSLRGFIGHTILADTVAMDIGWPIGSPFQIELAFYHLGLGIMGILCIWKRDSIWIGLIYSKSIFLLGAAGVHFWDIFANQNHSHGNTGTILYLHDLALPIISIILLHIYLKFQGEWKKNE
ncbi:hypothetical protein NEF87_003148 [Candidatus Lokiarchaeum ossiferum]|uniref:Uncharacterized protein n=1 Tax=Candidatus Lokiarchaeum ossiferum TaxID=2951803 RepID=A0ABY6HU46_9ARCH|nr:hypothetical protein NEF87_003148 [Candidatus Lokiarchaeum sp. B-35]